MQNKICYLVALLLMLNINKSIMAQGVDPGTDNLAHAWTFNDGTTNDYVGGASGTLMGAADIADGSLLLLELDAWLELPAADIAINTYEEITIEAWFLSFFDANTGYHMLAFFGTTVNTVGNDYYFITPARVMISAGLRFLLVWKQVHGPVNPAPTGLNMMTVKFIIW